MRKTDTIEILYVAGSSLDRKGKRILVRDHGGVENVIYQEDGISEADRALLGLSDTDQEYIERFLRDRGNVGVAQEV